MKVNSRHVLLCLCLIGLAIGVVAYKGGGGGQVSPSAKTMTPEPATPAPATPPAPSRLKPLGADKRAALDAFANPPIVFYGRVVDEVGDALGAVKANGTVSHNILSPDGRDRIIERLAIEVVTDTAGRFTVNDKLGSVLQISNLTKEGYRYLPPASRGVFSYALGGEFHKPDPDAPVSFLMVKKGVQPNLREAEYPLSFQWNGNPVEFELDHATPGAARLSITAVRRGFEASSYKFEWCLDVRLDDGEVLFVGDKPEFLAPRDGYTDMVAMGRGFKERKVNLSGGESWLIARSGNAHYLLVKLEIRPDSRVGAKKIGKLTVVENLDGTRLLAKPE